MNNHTVSKIDSFEMVRVVRAFHPFIEKTVSFPFTRKIEEIRYGDNSKNKCIDSYSALESLSDFKELRGFSCCVEVMIFTKRLAFLEIYDEDCKKSININA